VNDDSKVNGGPSPDLTNGALKGAMPKGKAPDPETHRIVQTKTGTVAVSRKQVGKPLSEFFGNVELPEDIARARVHDTPKGPLLLAAEPQGWTKEQAQRDVKHASDIKELIETKGYYARPMDRMAARMADQTGMPREDMKAVIVREFENLTGRDPYNFLNERRAEQGLPAKDRDPMQSAAPVQERG